MSNIGKFFNSVRCKDRNLCKSPEYYCKTCLRNKANRYQDNFSLSGHLKSDWDVLNERGLTTKLKSNI